MSDPVLYCLLGALVLLLGGLIAMLCKTVPIAKKVYESQLVRTSPEKWGRVCSAPDNAEQLAMWNAGNRWADAHRSVMREVQIENEGLRLFGELYDFGGERCVIILPGRCESLCYSYYFAAPYAEAGVSVLVIDSRCHGRSDGTYSTIGVGESRDLMAWMRFLTQECGKTALFLHCICIGSNAAMLAMARPDCPKALRGFVSEGCYTTFRETFRTHMIADHRPLFPVLDLVMLEIYRHTGTNVLRDSPLRSIRKIRTPALFLFGEQDVFSRPDKSRKLFAACGSADKRLVWMPQGGHSHLRINNTEAYDRAVKEFVLSR